jgi:hypothetical protein
MYLHARIFFLACLLNHAAEHPQITNVPLLGRFLHAKIDTLRTRLTFNVVLGYT